VPDAFFHEKPASFQTVHR